MSRSRVVILVVLVAALGGGVFFAWSTSGPVGPFGPLAGASPSPHPEAAPTLRVEVVTVEGAPAAGCPFTFDGVAGVLDAQGTAALAPGRISIACDARGYALEDLRPQRGNVAHVQLQPQAELEVHVLASGGAPVRGAPVTLEHRGEGEGPAWPSAQATTDESGGVHAFLPPGTCVVQVRVGEQTLARAQQCPASEVSEIELRPGMHWLSGRVLDSHRAPLGDVEVTARQENGSISVRSDQLGRFRIEGLPEGRADVRADLKERHLSAVHDTRVDAEVTIELSEDPWITGRALDDTGAPVELLLINTYQVEAPDGGFAFSYLPAGEQLELVIAAAGFVPTVTKAASLHSDVGVVRLARGRDLRGVVVEAGTGRPVADAWVNVLAGGFTVSRVSTDEHGQFELSGLGPTASLSVVGAGFVRLEVTRPTSTDARLELQRGASLHVTAEVDEGTVNSLRLVVGGPSGMGRRTFSGLSEVSLNSLEPGLWRLRGSVTRCRGKTCDELELEPVALTVSGSGTSELVLHPLVDGRTVQVRARGLTLEDLRRAVLVAGSIQCPSTRADLEVAFTGPVRYLARNLSFEHVPPGSYTLLLMHGDENWPSVATQLVTVTENPGAALEVAAPKWKPLGP